MKILFIHNRYQYRGGEDTTVEMEKDTLDAQGHQTRLLEFTNDGIQSLGSRISAGWRSFYNPASVRLLKEELKGFTPDAIHVHNLFFDASPSVLYEAARRGIPVVMTIHNYRFICANALLMREGKVCELCTGNKFPLSGIKHKCYRSSSLESALVTGITGLHKSLKTLNKTVATIVVPSQFLKDKLTGSSLSYPANRMLVKPNFIHDPGCGPSDREDFFLFVGRLSKEKGIDTLLECFLRRPDLRLVIAGDGPEKDSLLTAIKDSPSINYIGPQPKGKILMLMQQTKALIFPSIWYEGLPLTIIEAFSTGTPVIAAGLGAMSEMIVPGYNGLHFTPGSAKDLESCLQCFMLPDESRAFYTQARQSYESRYHPDIHYASIMNIYRSLLNTKDQYV
jgi:glycosyltransferase involved in cell wall biosynthesis